MSATTPFRREQLQLSVLFGVLYFVQGIAEPTEGLIAQPVRSLLNDWQYTAGQIGTFVWAISLPWFFKPLYGFLSDFFPILGSRRKSYLLLSSVAVCVSLLMLFWLPMPYGSANRLMIWLVIPTLGIAVADVAVDGLMIEKGKPLGMTGRLQSIQWSAMYAATILTGFLGGWLSKWDLQVWAFLICGLAMLPTIAIIEFVHEPKVEISRQAWRAELRVLADMLRNPTLWAMSAFLLLWSINPFSTTVLQLYVTEELNLDEQDYGYSLSIQAIPSLIASISYGFYCRRVPFAWLIHGSIICGILATIGYWFVHDFTTLILVSVAVGFVYMTGTIIQLDLAARTCPTSVAASVFATLMAVTNIGLSLSHLFGGYLYDLGAGWWDRPTSFRVLVGIGALTTCGCWLLVPRLRRQAALASDGQVPPKAE